MCGNPPLALSIFAFANRQGVYSASTSIDTKNATSTEGHREGLGWSPYRSMQRYQDEEGNHGAQGWVIASVLFKNPEWDLSGVWGSFTENT